MKDVGVNGALPVSLVSNHFKPSIQFRSITMQLWIACVATGPVLLSKVKFSAFSASIRTSANRVAARAAYVAVCRVLV